MPETLQDAVPANMPDPRERRFTIERDVLKLAFQYPGRDRRSWSDLEAEDFTHPYYRAIFTTMSSLGGPGQRSARGSVSDGDRRCQPSRLSLSALRMEQLHVTGDPDQRVASAYVVRLRELTALRRIEQVKSKLQRTNPVTEVTEYNRMFGELVALESHRRSLREQAIGTSM